MRESELFIAAMQIKDPTARAAYLDQVCGGDGVRRQHIDHLLDLLGDVDDFLQRPILAHDSATLNRFSTLNSQATSDLPGTMIGAFQLKEPIGEGGMGTVWLAEQTEPMRRQVALKVIKPGMDSHQVIARFEAERQALCMMDHHNIAKVLDAGTSADRRPFFVMELVRGQPITEYCDEHQLTPRERLELFLPVCHAIQHAHQKGIIHRDIKPSNVLVAEYEGRPVTKVIDFGVAKALSQPLAEITLLTGLGQIVGTLEYMSPEQARGSQVDVDTRSDIYSLGVLLYELLTGGTPFDRQRLHTTAFDEMLRIIREEDPPRPSTRITSLGASAPQFAINRGTDVGHLKRLLAGDLDWITMKALEKDRGRRYETANGLAMDIQRHLDGDVVQACPPSAGYQLKKFVGRNTAAVLAVSLVLFSLIAGTAAATVGMVQATRSQRAEARQRKLAELRREEAEAARRLAEKAAVAERLARQDERLAREEEARQRSYAEAITDFVKNDFLALTSVAGQLRFDNSGLSPLSKDTTLRELLDRAAIKLDARTDLAPQAEAQLHWMLGVNYGGTGEYQRSVAHLERGLELYIAHHGQDHEDTLRIMNDLANAYRDVGQADKVLPLYEQVFELRKSRLGMEHADTLMSMKNLAGQYCTVGRFDDALPMLEQALEHATEIGDPNDPLTLMCLGALAEGYHAAGQYDMALPLYEVALKRRREVLGPDHLLTLQVMNNLATCYQAAGQLDQSLPLYERSLAIIKATLGADHPLTLKILSNLAADYYHSGERDRAHALWQETLTSAKAKLGPDHPQTLQIMSNIGVSWWAVGELDKSIPLFEEVLRSRRARLGEQHPLTLAAVDNLCVNYRAAGRLDEAIQLLEEIVPQIPGDSPQGSIHRDLRLLYMKAAQAR